MVDNPEELTEVEMYRDPDTGKLIGRDPETGDTFPIPFDQISANSVQSDTAQVDGTATVDALEAEQADTRSGYVDKSADRSFETWYQNTTGADLDVSVVIGSDTDGSDIQGFLEVNETQETKPVSRFRNILDANFRFTLSATVAEGEYYRVRLTGDDQNATKDEWKEQQ